MPRRSATIIPGPPAGGRRSYIDQVLETRPDGTTVTIADRIIQAVRAGNYLETAAAAAGVHIQTIRTWITTGNATLRLLNQGTPASDLPRADLRYAEFAYALARAEAEAESEDVARLQQLARGQARTHKEVTTIKRDANGAIVEQSTRVEDETLAPDSAALRWRLEKRHPRRWAGTHRIELTGEEGGPVELTVTEKRAHLLETIEAIAAARDDELTQELTEATG